MPPRSGWTSGCSWSVFLWWPASGWSLSSNTSLILLIQVSPQLRLVAVIQYMRRSVSLLCVARQVWWVCRCPTPCPSRCCCLASYPTSPRLRCSWWVWRGLRNTPPAFPSSRSSWTHRWDQLLHWNWQNSRYRAGVVENVNRELWFPTGLGPRTRSQSTHRPTLTTLGLFSFIQPLCCIFKQPFFRI